MANVQPENGTLPIAYALAEAFSRDKERGLVDRITWWILRNTYGRRPRKGMDRRKICAFNWAKIAKDIGASRERVSRVGREMIATKRIVAQADQIGIQKDFDKWERDRSAPPRAKRSRVTVPHPQRDHVVTPTVTVPHPPLVRARNLSRKESKPGSLTRPAAIAARETAPHGSLLPNGLPDTIRNRAKFGSLKIDPKDHPDYERWAKSAPFAEIKAIDAEWEENVQERKYKQLERQREENVRLGLEAP